MVNGFLGSEEKRVDLRLVVVKFVSLQSKRGGYFHRNQSQGRKEPSIFSIIITTVCSHSLLYISCLFKKLHILLYVNIDVILIFLYDKYILYVYFYPVFYWHISSVSFIKSDQKLSIVTCWIQTLIYCNFCFHKLFISNKRGILKQIQSYSFIKLVINGLNFKTT